MSFWLICPRKCISSYGRGSDRLLIYVNLKNNIVTTWKLRVIFFSSGIFRTSSLEGSISSYPVSPSLRKWGGEWGYIGVFQGRAGSQNIKRLLLIKENQKSQVKKFSTFLCIGRCKSLGSLKLFLSYAAQLSGASILCFQVLSSPGAHRREWLQSLMAAEHVSCSVISSSLQPHGL